MKKYNLIGLLKIKIDENGYMDLDMIPFLMLLLSIVAFTLDTFMLVPRLNALSEASAYAIKAVERQGGVSTSAFLHLEADSFTTSDTLVKNINSMLLNAGYDTTKTEIIINGHLVDSDSKIGPYDYGEEILITVRGTFPYQFSNTINPDFNQTIQSDKLGVSTYILRDQ